MKSEMLIKEEMIIKETDVPRTRDRICNDLKSLGIAKGETLIVHVSLSSLGWVNGGPIALIQALMDSVTPMGTIVMPAHSGDMSEPSFWQNPPVPQPWIDEIRETMPVYDPDLTPTRGIGRVAEAFRTFPGVIRSAHPQLSFTAWGRNAELIIRDHGLNNALGPASPLGKLYKRNATILLLGVDHSVNTSLHLAEYFSGIRSEIEQGAPMMVNGKRKWVTMKDIYLNDERFAALGEDYETKYPIISGRVGSALSKKIEMHSIVDFATSWLKSDAEKEDAEKVDAEKVDDVTDNTENDNTDKTQE